MDDRPSPVSISAPLDASLNSDREPGLSSHREEWRRRRRDMEENGHLQSVVGPRSRWAINLKRRLLQLFHLGTPPFRLRRIHDTLFERTKDIEFVHHRITVPTLPESFDGYRIIHLSDPHFDSLPGLEERIFEQLAGKASSTIRT